MHIELHQLGDSRLNDVGVGPLGVGLCGAISAAHPSSKSLKVVALSMAEREGPSMATTGTGLG